MIRPANEKDSEVLTAISFASKAYWKYPKAYLQIWQDELTITSEYIEKNDVFVYEREKFIRGYYSITVLEEDIKISGITLDKGAWLDHMFIDPPFIGQGIGSTLFAHLRKRCIVEDIQEIGILADPNSRGFYEKMGCCYIRDYPSTIEGRTTPFLQYKPLFQG
ncbi:MAG: GNAT family N-acetyltransferase [Desulfopila sp.]|jgi:GNAT superfamily N-acetyltransferase|nr:GNAT family N-acetyltransferase [Desulfopila sp.]